MGTNKLKFDEIKKSNNPEIINDFLIDLSNDPNEDHLFYIRELIEETLNDQILNKIILNVIFLLGEIGKKTSISEYYQNFVYENYHRSDRWIRNEIIQTIEKISKRSKLNKKLIILIWNAINDDYDSIQLNALKVLLNLKSFSDSVFNNILHTLNSKNSEVLEGCRKVFNKIQLDANKLFNLLNQKENYKILKSRAIRSLLLIQFKSIIPLESFRGNIEGSDWEDSYKDNFLKEIDTFKRILSKNI